jgi:hypothetical protein
MVGDYKKNTLPSHVQMLDTTHQMFHVSVQEFKEYVRLSDSWSELARRCGETEKFGRFCSGRCVTILKQKVLFLKLDTQHFTHHHSSMKTRIAEISPEDFTEFVRLSLNWSDLASRCGEPGIMNNVGMNWRLVKYLKQKAVSLDLDTQHFGPAVARRALIADRMGEVGQCRVTVWGRSQDAIIRASLEELKTALHMRLAELEAGRLSDVPASEL